MKATVLDLRRRMPEILAALERNEAVELYHRGKIKGTIVPQGHYTTTSETARPKVCEHPAFGIWSDREDLQDVSGYLAKLRQDRYRDL